MAASIKGLRWERTSEAIRIFVNRFGHLAPRRTILCTFDLDLDRFDAVIAPELTRRGKQFRTLVLADAGELQKQFGRAGRNRLGRYEIAPVRLRAGGVFHPKLMLLAAGRHVLVGLGSANLTPGGLGGNLELMMFADNSADVGARIVGGAAHFLDRLLRCSAIAMPTSAREFVEIALPGIRRDTDCILDSITAPLLDQMKAVHRANYDSGSKVSVLSPWHSSLQTPDGVDPRIIRRFRKSFGADRIAVFTSGQNGRAPNLGEACDVFIRAEQVLSNGQGSHGKGDPESLLERRPTRVHAKAYLIESKRAGGTLFFGSANCTEPALDRPVGRGGNVELLTASKLDRAQVRQVLSDLTDLFPLQPKNTFSVKPPTQPRKPAGVILAGSVTNAGAISKLRIETTLPSCRVQIACEKEPEGRLVTVVAKGGIAWVTKSPDLQMLFKNNPLEREAESWGAILWEHTSTGRIPFPVFIPLIGGKAGPPDESFMDLVWEELGVWPAKSSPGAGDDGRDDIVDEEDDNDVEALAETKHQGKLDRLAVAASILRRRILAAESGTEYAAVRLKLRGKQVARLGLPPHLCRTLLQYLLPGQSGKFK